MKNVVYMGTPDFAAVILEKLLDSDWHVQAVFTQPDRPRGRSGKPQRSPVGAFADSRGIPVVQPVKIRQPENAEMLRALSPDVIVVAAFGQIIPQEILDIPPLGCINVHASLLPAYRGAAPIQWAILRGESVSGVTTMRMNRGLDTGDIIERREVPILPEDTGGSLFDKLSAAGAELLLSTLRKLSEGTAVFTPQPEESPTPYASMLTRQDGRVDWSSDAAAIERMVRGLDPWPGAFTIARGKQLKLWKAEVVSSAEGPLPEDPADALPGTVLGLDGGLLVFTGEGRLLIREVQLEGKKRMSAEAFLRGFPIAKGERLG